jgi:hypothetical protein
MHLFHTRSASFRCVWGSHWLALDSRQVRLAAARRRRRKSPADDTILNAGAKYYCLIIWGLRCAPGIETPPVDILCGGRTLAAADGRVA